MLKNVRSIEKLFKSTRKGIIHISLQTMAEIVRGSSGTRVDRETNIYIYSLFERPRHKTEQRHGRQHRKVYEEIRKYREIKIIKNTKIEQAGRDIGTQSCFVFFYSMR